MTSTGCAAERGPVAQAVDLVDARRGRYLDAARDGPHVHPTVSSATHSPDGVPSNSSGQVTREARAGESTGAAVRRAGVRRTVAPGLGLGCRDVLAPRAEHLGGGAIRRGSCLGPIEGELQARRSPPSTTSTGAAHTHFATRRSPSRTAAVAASRSSPSGPCQYIAASTERAEQVRSTSGAGAGRGELPASAAATASGLVDGISSGSTGGHPKRLTDRPAASPAGSSRRTRRGGAGRRRRREPCARPRRRVRAAAGARAGRRAAGQGRGRRVGCIARHSGGPDSRAAGRIVLHGDFGPWNLVWRGTRPIRIIDWDYAWPGRLIHDVAYALEYVAPFRDDELCRRWLAYPDVPDRRRRLELFAEAYGLESSSGLVDEVLAQQQAVWERARRLALGARSPKPNGSRPASSTRPPTGCPLDPRQPRALRMRRGACTDLSMR